MWDFCSGKLTSFISSLVIKLDFLKVNPPQSPPSLFAGLEHLQQCQVNFHSIFAPGYWSKWMVHEKWSPQWGVWTHNLSVMSLLDHGYLPSLSKFVKKIYSEIFISLILFKVDVVLKFTSFDKTVRVSKVLRFRISTSGSQRLLSSCRLTAVSFFGSSGVSVAIVKSSGKDLRRWPLQDYRKYWSNWPRLKISRNHC